MLVEGCTGARKKRLVEAEILVCEMKYWVKILPKNNSFCNTLILDTISVYNGDLDYIRRHKKNINKVSQVISNITLDGIDGSACFALFYNFKKMSN